MGKIFVVTSGKGGVGKSTVAANLACGLAFDGRKVLLIDMDTGLRSLDLMLGMENQMVFDMTDVLDGICTAEQAIFPVHGREGLFLLPASQSLGSSALTPGDIKSLLGTFRESFDYIVLDCPAGIERGFRNAVSAAETALVVITPDYISLRSAERAFQLLTEEGVQDIRLIINRVSGRDPVSTDECIRQMELPVLGFLPDDPHVSRGTAQGIPAIDLDCPAGDAFERIVRRILGEDVRYRIPHEGLIHRIKTRFGKESHA